MERKIDEFLKKWKNDLIRKPLVIYGSKQVGKTFTVLEFCIRSYCQLLRRQIIIARMRLLRFLQQSPHPGYYNNLIYITD